MPLLVWLFVEVLNFQFPSGNGIAQLPDVFAIMLLVVVNKIFPKGARV